MRLLLISGFLQLFSLLRGVGAELRSSKDPQIASKYPIGHVDEPFAKPAGRIFEVNGTAKYLTGTNAWYLNRLDEGDLEITLEQIKDASSFPFPNRIFHLLPVSPSFFA